MSEKTTPLNVRMPTGLLAWVDDYVRFLSETSGGYTVSRTQALIRLVTLAAQAERPRMEEHKRAQVSAMSESDLAYLLGGTEGMKTMTERIVGMTQAERFELITEAEKNPQSKIKVVERGTWIRELHKAEAFWEAHRDAPTEATNPEKKGEQKP